MAAPGRPILGIDIANDEIRVVELVGRWPLAQVVRAGTTPLPAGTVVGGRIEGVEIAAAALRSLIGRLRTNTRDAVIGLGDRVVTTRVLEVPKVPDREAATVVRGELEHYQILHAGGGGFDFMRLQQSDRDVTTPPQALVMAADENMLAGYREVAARAGLRLVALEPVLLSLYRAGYLQVVDVPAAAYISISYGRTEIAIVDNGGIRLYRRIDSGTDDLIYGREAARQRQPSDIGGGTAGPDRVLLGGDDAVHAPDAVVSTGDDVRITGEDVRATGEIMANAAGNLAIDIQRSLEYYRREFAESRAVTRGFVATDDPQAEGLARWVGEALHIDLETVMVDRMASGARDVQAELQPPEGLRYNAAVGLAMGGLVNVPAVVKRFDLASQEQADPELEDARSKLVLSLVACIVVVALGIFFAFRFGNEANRLGHGLEHAKEELAAKQSRVKVQSEEELKRARQYQALRAAGFPLARIMDQVAGAVDPEAGLTDFSLDRSGKTQVSGEAATEVSVIRTLEGLKRLPFLTGTSLDSFDTGMTNTRNANEPRTVRFQIAAQVAGTGTPAGGAK